MGVQYIDEAGDLQYYKWYRNPIQWLSYKRAWRKLEKKVKVGGEFQFAGVSTVKTINAFEPAPMHFTDKHFTAVTIEGRVFLYCPEGNICSWSAGDVEHKYCAYCKKFFNELEGK